MQSVDPAAARPRLTLVQDLVGAHPRNSQSTGRADHNSESQTKRARSDQPRSSRHDPCSQVFRQIARPNMKGNEDIISWADTHRLFNEDQSLYHEFSKVGPLGSFRLVRLCFSEAQRTDHVLATLKSLASFLWKFASILL